MFKNLFLSIVLAACTLSATMLHANQSIDLRQYIKKNFANDLKISQQQLQRLSWLLEPDKRRFDLEMLTSTDDNHIEVIRALTRLYCLQLLKSGTKRDYDKFIAAQLENSKADTLTFNAFKKLSKHIQQLTATDYATLEKLAIYSVPAQNNFRHMLYTEGGAGMFKHLRSMIQHQYTNAAEIDLWYCYWIIDIAGFRGQVSHNGSVYLTESVFQAMYKLKVLIAQMLESPNFNPLLPYLEYRAEILGFKSLPTSERLLLAHLGALMNLYNAEDGSQLLTGFRQLTAKQRQQMTVYFNSKMLNYEHPNQTYIPPLFANTLVLTKGNIKQTLKIILPIYNQAVNQYIAAQTRGAIAPEVALSFNALSSSQNLKKIIRSGANGTQRIKVRADGEVIPVFQ
jgi:hypothetical protein